MRSTIVCDIDGTLVAGKVVNRGLVRLLRVLVQEHDLLFLTGRIDQTATYSDLRHLALMGALHCRPSDRKRESPHRWKLEELARIKQERSILMLIDDDPRMRKGAEALGVTAL